MAPDTHTDDNGDESEYTVKQEQELTTALDPELQQVVLELRSKPPEAADEPVGVIAILRNPDDEIPDELKVRQYVGSVVTGTVTAGRIEAVRSHQNILSLKGTRRLYPTLDYSVPEIRATPPQLRDAVPDKDLGGDGVIVGIIDHGCDFFHPNFRNDDKTRILFLWDQRGERGPAPQGFSDGTEYDATEINQALTQSNAQDAYKFLGYEPVSPHGTHVTDIAAGSGNTTKRPPGVAPRADIIFVDVADDDVPQEAPFGDSIHLLEAVKYVFQKADELSKSTGTRRSAVVNISLNSDAGPHDGSTPLEVGIDDLLKTPGRAVVIAAGNSWGDNHHAALHLQPGQEQTLTWEIQDGDETANKVEFWYDGSQEVELFLISPRDPNRRLGPFHLGATNTIDRNGEPAARVFHRQDNPINHDNQILIIFGPRMESGVWRIVFSSRTQGTFTVQGWIAPDSVRSFFPELDLPRDNAYTIGSISCGHSSIAVGGYHSLDGQSLLDATAEGPTRDNRRKPEVSAPGATEPNKGIKAAFAGTRTSAPLAEGGTSSAAPHVTGLIALLMQSAGRPLTTEEIRDLVTDYARLNPPTGNFAWHPRYGVGRVDASATLAITIVEGDGGAVE